MAAVSDRARNALILVGGALSLGGLLVVSRLWGEVWRCPFGMATGLPCPGCGGLRAFGLLSHGDVAGALWMNPLSIVLMAFFAVSAVWLTVDIVRGGRSWLDFTGRRWTKTATVCAVAVLLLNWAFNLYKGV